jgi:hypothetical protein
MAIAKAHLLKVNIRIGDAPSAWIEALPAPARSKSAPEQPGGSLNRLTEPTGHSKIHSCSQYG